MKSISVEWRLHDQNQLKIESTLFKSSTIDIQCQLEIHKYTPCTHTHTLTESNCIGND